MFFAGDQHHFNIGNHLLASQQLKLPAHGEQTSFKRDSIHRHHHHRPHLYHYHHHQPHLYHHHHDHAIRCLWTASKWEPWSQESTVTPSQVFAPSSYAIIAITGTIIGSSKFPFPNAQSTSPTLFHHSESGPSIKRYIQSTFQSFFKMKHYLFLPVFWLT